jgi:DNA-binding PadR family transcriptional regulator
MAKVKVLVKRRVRSAPIGALTIERSIMPIRGEKVLLDGELAALYGVPIKALLQAVKRNLDRFPSDFMFKLTAREAEFLRSQTVSLENGRLAGGRGGESGRGRHRKYLPYAFTEQGVAMLSSVLRSPRAVAVNIEIMRAFVRLRQIISEHKDLREKIAELEANFDDNFRAVFEAIDALMEEEESPVTPIGFRAPDAVKK